ncbi:MAG: 50S ribosomal protein L19 [Candidatus Moraniibacteriota bacterium]
MHQKLIAFNQAQRRSYPLVPDLQSGDVVRISRKIREGAKERIQIFQGTIIAINGGQSSSKTITVRKDSFGIGVELVLPLSSPQIEKIEFVKRTKTRRSKLYFVRDKSVKVLRKKLKEVSMKGILASLSAAAVAEKEAEAAPAPESEEASSPEPIEEPVETTEAPEESPAEDSTPVETEETEKAA